MRWHLRAGLALVAFLPLGCASGASSGPGGPVAASPSPAPQRPPQRPAPPPPEPEQSGPVEFGKPATAGGEVRGAWQALEPARADLVICYRRELGEDRHWQGETPATEGALRVSVDVGADGAVTGAHAAQSGHFSGTLPGCAEAAMKRLRFQVAGGPAVLVVPITFGPPDGLEPIAPPPREDTTKDQLQMMGFPQ